MSLFAELNSNPKKYEYGRYNIAFPASLVLLDIFYLITILYQVYSRLKAQTKYGHLGTTQKVLITMKKDIYRFFIVILILTKIGQDILWCYANAIDDELKFDLFQWISFGLMIVIMQIMLGSFTTTLLTIEISIHYDSKTCFSCIEWYKNNYTVFILNIFILILLCFSNNI